MSGAVKRAALNLCAGSTRAAADPFGENSVCRTSGYERPDWTRLQGAPAGHLEMLGVKSEVFDEARQEQVYLPHGYTPERDYPLVVIHDGQEFDSFADLSVSLDNNTLFTPGFYNPCVLATTSL